MTKSKWKSKQPEDQPKTMEQTEGSARPETPTKPSPWRLSNGITELEGESHIFVGGFPCAPPKKAK
jgi:hypothetical protein